MSDLESIARDILSDLGEPVAYKAAGAADDAEALALSAIVQHHGFGHCPEGWNPDQFPGEARHAEIRLAGADVAQEPGRGSTISAGGLVFTVRQVGRLPKAGPEVMWWVCRAACQQAGRY